jgi:hypothetical protein
VPITPKGRLLTNEEVADILDPNHEHKMDRGSVTKAMSRAGLRAVIGWDEADAHDLKSYTDMPQSFKRRYTFEQWRALKDAEESRTTR